MGVQHLFDFTGIDIHAAPDNNVFFTIHDVKITVLIIAPHMPCVKPAVYNGFVGRLRPVQIPLHYIMAAYDNFTHLIDAPEGTVVHLNTHFNAPDRFAD